MVDLVLEKGKSFLSEFKDEVISNRKDGVIDIRFEDKDDKPKKQLKKALEKAQRKVLSIQKLEDTVGLLRQNRQLIKLN